MFSSTQSRKTHMTTARTTPTRRSSRLSPMMVTRNKRGSSYRFGTLDGTGEDNEKKAKATKKGKDDKSKKKKKERGPMPEDLRQACEAEIRRRSARLQNVRRPDANRVLAAMFTELDKDQLDDALRMTNEAEERLSVAVAASRTGADEDVEGDENDKEEKSHSDDDRMEVDEEKVDEEEREVESNGVEASPSEKSSSSDSETDDDDEEEDLVVGDDSSDDDDDEKREEKREYEDETYSKDDYGLPVVPGGIPNQAKFVRKSNKQRDPLNLEQYEFFKGRTLDPDDLDEIVSFWWEFVKEVRRPKPFLAEMGKRITTTRRERL